MLRGPGYQTWGELVANVDRFSQDHREQFLSIPCPVILGLPCPSSLRVQQGCIWRKWACERNQSHVQCNSSAILQ